MKIKLMSAAVVGAALALPLAASPALAQNDVLGGVQRLLNGGNNNDEAARQAYQQGREDQARQQQMDRDRWQREHARDRDRYNDRGYAENGRPYENPPPPRGYDNGRYSNGPYNNNTYNNGYGQGAYPDRR